MERFVPARIECRPACYDRNAYRRRPRVDARGLSVTVSALLVALGLVIAMLVQPAGAQSLTGTLSGEVKTSDGQSLPGATVELRGPLLRKTTSDANGAFAFRNLPAGIYSVTVEKTGFVSAAQSDVVLSAGSSATARFSLNQSSFDSLQEIGRTSVSSTRAKLNSSSASIVVTSGQSIIDQGQTQVLSALNQMPGVMTAINSAGNGNSSAFMGTQGVPVIRGTLPYETESLIDGHPVSVGLNGYFVANYINPYMLEDIEVVKGPGALVPEINYAIAGSINYITLQPTVKPVFAVDLGTDQYGGQSSNFRATGTTLSGKLGYALDYAITGSPGPIAGNQYLGASWFANTINGQSLCGNAPANAVCNSANGPVIPGFQNFNGASSGFFDQGLASLVVCCSAYNSYDTAFLNRSELAKLRFNFSTQTSFTASYLGAQGLTGFQAPFTICGPNCPANIFVPPAGYVAGPGEPAPGALINYANQIFYPQFQANQQGIFQSELRTTLGNSTFLARYYTGASNQFDYNYPYSQSPLTFTGQAYGGIWLGNNATPTIFNGQTITYQEGDYGFYLQNLDHFQGTTFEWNLNAGDSTYTLSYDRNSHNSSAFQSFASGASEGYTVPPSSGQTFQTILARDVFQFGPKIQAAVSTYFDTYITHYSPDGGTTFTDSSHSFFAPRLAFTWHPNGNTYVRAATGWSIAPPYISLLAVPATPPQGNASPATYYSQQISSGTLQPETAFSWDVGVDQRLGASNIVVSADLYQNVLRNQFLQSWVADGTYTPTTGINAGIAAPLYNIINGNLGHSMYEGAELSVRRDVERGFGFNANISLMRAYAYDLPAGFYDTGNGSNTTNLGIIPYTNFNGYDLGISAVPYAQGYAELNYTVHKLKVAAGVTYFGNNNTYNEPAFGVLQANIRYDLSKRAYLLVSGNNLTNAYGSAFFTESSGTPVPLVNGQFGATAGGTIGPSYFRLNLHVQTGS